MRFHHENPNSSRTSECTKSKTSKLFRSKILECESGSGGFISDAQYHISEGHARARSTTSFIVVQGRPSIFFHHFGQEIF